MMKPNEIPIITAVEHLKIIIIEKKDNGNIILTNSKICINQRV